jgi:DNA polymerase beta
VFQLDSLSVNALMLNSFAACRARGAALLAHTGDADYNRLVRLQASKAGMLLNEYGLWEVSKPSSERDTVGREGTYLCPSETEEIILKQIGLDFVEPGKRNFANLRSKSRQKKALE